MAKSRINFKSNKNYDSDSKSRAFRILFSVRMLLFWIVIVITIFVAHYFSGFLEDMVVSGKSFAWALLFLWYLAWIAVIGTIMAYVIMRNWRRTADDE